MAKAELRAERLRQENRGSNLNFDYGRLQGVLAAFNYDRLEDIRYGLDYNAELRSRESLVTGETYPHLFNYMVEIPGDRGFGVERENHNFGYHIHYVQLSGGRKRRANAIFMFDPKEPLIADPLLYWEPHHEPAQLHINPGVFGNRRRMALYDTCISFLGKVPKCEFKMPSNKATRFYP